MGDGWTMMMMKYNSCDVRIYYIPRKNAGWERVPLPDVILPKATLMRSYTLSLNKFEQFQRFLCMEDIMFHDSNAMFTSFGYMFAQSAWCLVTGSSSWL